jgi:peptidoglycan/xylan/chitin deacetylase (PgdA/CDA1 family)
MRTILRRGKAAVLSGAYRAGVFTAVRKSRWRQRRLLILAYHGVSLEDEHEWHPGIYMSPAKFESRLDALDRGGYTVLPLGDALEALRESRLPPRSVALTFDDGNYDFFRQVFPMLKRRGMPATVYLTTYYCQYNRPVFQLVCSYMLWKRRVLRSLHIGPLTGQDLTFDLSSAESRMQVVKSLVDFADTQQLSARDKDKVAAHLASLIGFDYEALCKRRLLHLMNPDEVASLARQSVDFQLHTHRHNCPHDPESFSREIRDNRVCIDRLTRHSPRHFCYPSGRYKSYFLPWLEHDQVASATTCDPGLATASTSPLLLPRFVDTQTVPAATFEAWLSGAASWLTVRRRDAD